LLARRFTPAATSPRPPPAFQVSLVKPGMPFQIAVNYESKRKTSTVVGFYKVRPAGQTIAASTRAPLPGGTPNARSRHPISRFPPQPPTPRAQSERLFGSNAENIGARRPKHVFPAVQRTLGRNFTHASVVDYMHNSFLMADVAPNARGGATFTVPLEDSGLEYLLTPEATPSTSASGSASASASASAAATPKVTGIPFAAEELAGMLMAHARDFAQAFSGGPVMDAVITVPAYAAQNERLALLDAAELAGLNVLALVDENTAAGVHYGIDRVFDNGTHHMLLYNMGAEATQATLFAYDAYTVPDPKAGKGANKTVGQARVVAKAWDPALGGRHFDAALVNHVAEKFNAAKAADLPPSAKGDIRNAPAAMAKIRRVVVKAKEVLSANEEYGASFESVLPDVDFRVQLSRKVLEEVAVSGENGGGGRVWILGRRSRGQRAGREHRALTRSPCSNTHTASTPFLAGAPVCARDGAHRGGAGAGGHDPGGRGRRGDRGRRRAHAARAGAAARVHRRR
jgi:molecular chaperone DnaK (HSP70)